MPPHLAGFFSLQNLQEPPGSYRIVRDNYAFFPPWQHLQAQDIEGLEFRTTMTDRPVIPDLRRNPPHTMVARHTRTHKKERERERRNVGRPSPMIQEARRIQKPPPHLGS